jgi:ubiquitin carboxyl-terminal hydrolase 16/45
VLAQTDPTSPEAKFPKLRQSQAQYISQILGGPSLSASTVQHLRSLSMSMPAPPSPASSDGASGALPPLPSSPVLGATASPMSTGQNGLMDALRQFTSVEVLDGDNAFACKKCWRFDHPRRDGKPWRRGGERPDDSDDDDEQDEAARVGSGLDGPVDGVGTAGGDQPLEAIQDVDDDVEAAAHARGADIQALADLHLNGDEQPTAADLVKLDSKLAEIDGLPSRVLESPAVAEAVLRDESVPTATFGGPPHPHGHQHEIPSIIETPFSPVEEKPAPVLPVAARPTADGSSLNLPPRSSRAHQLTKTLSRGKSYMKHSNPEFQVVEDSDSDNSDASSIGGTDDEATTAASGATTPGSKASPAKGPKSVMRRAFKRYLIVNPPPILVFHLKRFEQIFGGKGFSPFGGFTTSVSCHD